jgi:RNA polymerase sigma-70 factor, ECF subfamily
METDWELVERVKAGDMEAFGLLYRHYYKVVFAVVLKRTKDWHLAEDLTGETFLRALRKIDSVSDQGQRFPAWLVTIAVNLHLDLVKSSYYRLDRSWYGLGNLEYNHASLGHEMMYVAEPRNPEEVQTSLAILTELRRCVSELSPRYRQCIELRFMQGKSHAETAAEMGGNETSNRMLQHHAIKRLATMMKEAA